MRNIFCNQQKRMSPRHTSKNSIYRENNCHWLQPLIQGTIYSHLNISKQSFGLVWHHSFSVLCCGITDPLRPWTTKKTAEETNFDSKQSYKSKKNYFLEISSLRLWVSYRWVELNQQIFFQKNHPIFLTNFDPIVPQSTNRKKNFVPSAFSDALNDDHENAHSNTVKESSLLKKLQSRKKLLPKIHQREINSITSQHPSSQFQQNKKNARDSRFQGLCYHSY